ncbi:MAG: hypothetical protein EZS28_036303, partial [Streblomastix strix]
FNKWKGGFSTAFIQQLIPDVENGQKDGFAILDEDYLLDIEPIDGGEDDEDEQNFEFRASAFSGGYSIQVASSLNSNCSTLYPNSSSFQLLLQSFQAFCVAIEASLLVSNYSQTLRFCQQMLITLTGSGLFSQQGRTHPAAVRSVVVIVEALKMIPQPKLTGFITKTSSNQQQQQQQQLNSIISPISSYPDRILSPQSNTSQSPLYITPQLLSKQQQLQPQPNAESIDATLKAEYWFQSQPMIAACLSELVQCNQFAQISRNYAAQQIKVRREIVQEVANQFIIEVDNTLHVQIQEQKEYYSELQKMRAKRNKQQQMQFQLLEEQLLPKNDSESLERINESQNQSKKPGSDSATNAKKSQIGGIQLKTISANTANSTSSASGQKSPTVGKQQTISTTGSKLTSGLNKQTKYGKDQETQQEQDKEQNDNEDGDSFVSKKQTPWLKKDINLICYGLSICGIRSLLRACQAFDALLLQYLQSGLILPQGNEQSRNENVGSATERVENELQLCAIIADGLTNLPITQGQFQLLLRNHSIAKNFFFLALRYCGLQHRRQTIKNLITFKYYSAYDSNIKTVIDFNVNQGNEDQQQQQQQTDNEQDCGKKYQLSLRSQIFNDSPYTLVQMTSFHLTRVTNELATVHQLIAYSPQRAWQKLLSIANIPQPLSEQDIVIAPTFSEIMKSLSSQVREFKEKQEAKEGSNQQTEQLDKKNNNKSKK